jgi:hypothetical protein
VLGFGNLIEAIEDQQDAVAADKASGSVGAERRDIRKCRVLFA